MVAPMIIFTEHLVSSAQRKKFLPTPLIVASLLPTFTTTLSTIENLSISPSIRIAIIMLASYVVASWVTSNKITDQRLHTMLVGQAAIGVVFSAAVAGSFFYEGRLSGSNTAATYILMALPSMLFLPWRNSLKIAGALVLTVLGLLTLSRMLFLGIIAMFLVFIFRSNQSGYKISKSAKWFAALAGLLATLATILVHQAFIEGQRESSNDERMNALLSVFDVLWVYPFTGLGWGGWAWRHMLPDVFSENQVLVHDGNGGILSLNPHNGLARLACDLGFTGVIMFTAFFCLAVVRTRRIRNGSRRLQVELWLSVLSILFMFSDPMEHPGFWLIFFMTIEASKRREYSPANKSRWDKRRTFYTT